MRGYLKGVQGRWRYSRRGRDTHSPGSLWRASGAPSSPSWSGAGQLRRTEEGRCSGEQEAAGSRTGRDGAAGKVMEREEGKRVEVKTRGKGGEKNSRSAPSAENRRERRDKDAVTEKE